MRNHIKREAALVQIGNRQVMARVEVAPSEALEQKRTFVRAMALRQNHQCPAVLMGEFCGHLL